MPLYELCVYLYIPNLLECKSMSNYLIPAPKNLYNVSIKKLLGDFLNFTNKNLIFFDIETLGLSSHHDYEQVLQISAWCIDSETNQKKDELNIKIRLSEATTFFLSGMNKKQNNEWKCRQKRRGSILNEPNEILQITNYFNLNIEEMTEQMGLQSFCEFISLHEDAILVAHNIDFDIKFLISRCKFHNINFCYSTALDTLKISQYFFAPLIQTLADDNKECNYYLTTLRGLSKTNRHTSSKLGHLATALGYSSEKWHTASADVEMMFYVFSKITTLLHRHKNVDISMAQTTELNKTQKTKRVKVLNTKQI